MRMRMTMTLQNNREEITNRRAEQCLKEKSTFDISHASRQRVFHTRTPPHDQHNRLIVFYVNMLYLFVCAQRGCKMARSISIVKRVHGENKILAFKLGSESWRNVFPWAWLVAGSCARWNQFTSKIVFAIWMSSSGVECVRVCVCALCSAHEWLCRKIVNCLDDFERSNFRMKSKIAIHIAHPLLIECRQRTMQVGGGSDQWSECRVQCAAQCTDK